MPESRIRGVIPAVPTPVCADGRIDVAAFVEHAQWCFERGADALNVLGTTGEANALSFAQRHHVMTAAAQQLDTRRLIVGTGVPDLETTLALTRAAFDLGYAGALLLPPYYYKPVSDDGLFSWFSSLVAQTQTTPIALYLYNFPQLTGITFSPTLAARLKTAFPDRLQGMKDSSGNLDDARQFTHLPNFRVFPSNEVALTQARDSHFAGCISATVNINPALSAALWRDPGNPQLLEQVAALRQAVSAYPLVSAVKWSVAKRTGNPVWARVLAPNMPITDAAAIAVLKRLTPPS